MLLLSTVPKQLRLERATNVLYSRILPIPTWISPTQRSMNHCHPVCTSEITDGWCFGSLAISGQSLQQSQQRKTWSQALTCRTQKPVEIDERTGNHDKKTRGCEKSDMYRVRSLNTVKERIVSIYAHLMLVLSSIGTWD